MFTKREITLGCVSFSSHVRHKIRSFGSICDNVSYCILFPTSRLSTEIPICNAVVTDPRHEEYATIPTGYIITCGVRASLVLASAPCVGVSRVTIHWAPVFA